MNPRRSRGFARVPRELPEDLAGLPGSAHAILYHLLVAGADRTDGYRTSLGAIADALELSLATVKRQMPELRARGLVEYDSRTTRTHVFRMGPAYWGFFPFHEQPVTAQRAELEPSVMPDVLALMPDDPASAHGSQLVRAQAVTLGTETETETETETSRKRRWIENLNSYTGCHQVRGTHAFGHRYDPLGTDRPPVDWPHKRPSRDEIHAALDAQKDGT